MANATFTSMDVSTKDEWLAMLRSLGNIVDGFSTDQLTHCLQTATMAERWVVSGNC